MSEVAFNLVRTASYELNYHTKIILKDEKNKQTNSNDYFRSNSIIEPKSLPALPDAQRSVYLRNKNNKIFQIIVRMSIIIYKFDVNINVETLTVHAFVIPTVGIAPQLSQSLKPVLKC